MSNVTYGETRETPTGIYLPFGCCDIVTESLQSCLALTAIMFSPLLNSGAHLPLSSGATSSRSTPPWLSRSISHVTYAEKEPRKPRFLAFLSPAFHASEGILTVFLTKGSSAMGGNLRGRLIVLPNQSLDVITERRELVLLLPGNGDLPKLGRHTDGGSDGLLAFTFGSHFIPSMTK